jgi:NADH:ubiquinone oxidoreductase subunit E
VRERLEKMLGIEPGQTTADGRFTLEVVNCIGACDQAPAMLVDHELHGRLTIRKIARILKSYL